jgi:hypothetical protein
MEEEEREDKQQKSIKNWFKKENKQGLPDRDPLLLNMGLRPLKSL